MLDVFDSEFQANEPLGGGQSISGQPMAVLPDGRIVVVWHGANGGGDSDTSGFGNGIRARILNADGSPAGPDILVNTTLPQIQADANVAVLSDGRFVVTWLSFDGLGDGDPDTRNACIRARVFNADGTPASYNGSGAGASTDDFVVNTAAAGTQYEPTVTALPGGGFVIGFISQFSNPFVNEVAIRRYTASGPAAPEQMISTAGVNAPDGPAMITLPDGRFVVAWFHDSPDNGPQEIQGGVRARFFNADGTPDMTVNGGNHVTLDSSNIGQQKAPQLTLLVDGRILATWVSYDDNAGNPDGDPSASVRARVFLPNGTPDPAVNSGLDFQVNTSTLRNQDTQHAVGLPDGGFLITFSSSSDAPIRGTLGRAFSATGIPDGPDFVIQDEEVPDTSRAPNAVILMPDGRVLVLTDQAGGQPSAILGRFYDDAATGVTFDGTNVPDQRGGTRFADTLNGSGGGDFLAGGRGNDTMTGGTGNDTLSGGADDDSLNGGGGDDTLIAGPGTDTLTGASGIDIAVLGLVDVPAGLTFALSPTGASQIIGADTIATVEGIELTLGDGKDTVTGGVAADALRGAGGNDTLAGLLGNDVLDGGTGDDALDGGGGDDTMVGGAGNDSFAGGTGVDTVDFSGSGNGVAVNLTLAGPQFTGQGTDSFSGVENLIGSAFNDTFTGQNLLNRFDGAGGDDELRGGSGTDTLNGDAGADLIVGDAGNDVIDGGSDIDRLYGGSGEDTILGGDGADSIAGGPGVDRVDGGEGADRLYADGTPDTFVFTTGVGGGDRVFDFVSGVHDIEIDASAFGGTAGAFAFVQGATPTPASAQQVLLYDTDDGKLYFDADGTGAGGRVHILTLYLAPALAAGDVVLV